MTSILLRVTGARAWAEVSGPLTAGMVGLPVTIEYDGAWEGLTKNLVCRCSPWECDSGETRTILNVGDSAAVAHEVMKAGLYLHLGVEGFSEDGTLVIPTTWAMCGEIQYGADADADPSADPELPIWNQLQAQIEQINRDGITQERMDEIRACAETASQAATDAARSEQNAAASASLAISNANAAESFAAQAKTSEQNARASASSAANLANGALQAQRAAEAAAERAEAAAEFGQNAALYIGPDEPVSDNRPLYWLDTSGGSEPEEPEEPEVPAEPDGSDISTFVLNEPYLGSKASVLGENTDSGNNPAIVAAGNPAANLPLTDYLASNYDTLYAVSYRPNAGDVYGGPAGWRAYRYGDLGDGIPVWQEQTQIAEISVSSTSGVDANKLKIHKLVRSDILAALDSGYAESDIRAIMQTVPNVGSKNYNVSVVWMTAEPTEEQQQAIIAYFEGGGN